MKPVSDKHGLLFLLDHYYLLLRHKWVRQMNDLTGGLSRKTLICLLVFFVLSAAGYLLWNIYASFV